ncbi:MAG: sigma-70 family RNA polymerase sigma factor [Kiritimatiellae bacterium]|nr:sigma-70 family RNA polymerase sigma factor [Kiritimatiellia bacterium]
MDVHAVILRVIEGDVEAFSEIVHTFHVSVGNVIAATFPNATRVEELAQETFVRAYFQLSNFDLDRPFWFWLRGIARNVVREALRAESRNAARREAFAEALLLDEAERELEQSRGGAEEETSLRALQECLNALPEKSRHLVELFHKDGLSSSEIAKRLGRGASAIRNALVRVRHALRDCVQSRLQPEVP